MCIAFAGYLALRRFVGEPQRRANWSAIVAIIIYADISLVWFSVKWWNSLYQVQSSTQTVAEEMYIPLRACIRVLVFDDWFYPHALPYRSGDAASRTQ